MSAAPPICGVVKDALLVVLLVLAVTLTTVGSELIQLRNEPLIVVPDESVMVGVMVPPVPWATENEFVL